MNGRLNLCLLFCASASATVGCTDWQKIGAEARAKTSNKETGSPGDSIVPEPAPPDDGTPFLFAESAGQYFGQRVLEEAPKPFVWRVRNISEQPGAVTQSVEGDVSQFEIGPRVSDCERPDGVCTIEARFKPDSPGVKGAVLKLQIAGGNEVSLQLLGTGVTRMTLKKAGSGRGTLEVRANFRCDPNCSSASDLYGTTDTVSVTAMPEPGSYFAGFEGDCPLSAGPCTLSTSASREAVGRFETAQHNIAFVSTNRYPMNLGNAAAYDAACNAEATANGWNNPTSDGFIALMCNAGAGATARLGTGVGGFMRQDGIPFADSQTSLFQSGQVFHSLGRSELVATGLDASGQCTADCTGWTSNDPMDALAAGWGDAGPGFWLDWIRSSCEKQYPIYCFGRTRDVALVPARLTGKLAFLSNGALKMGESPDQLCDSSKPSGVGIVRALIARTGSAAASVVDPSAQYVRPDGQAVGKGSDLVSDTGVKNGIWQAGNGEYVSDFVWTGSSSVGSTGAPEDNCDDWSSGSGLDAIVGQPLNGARFWEQNPGGPAPRRACDSEPGFRVYCLEQ